MADQTPSFQFEDIPIEEARKIGRGPRMDPEIYHALKENIQSLDNTASRMSLPDGTSPTTMKNRILRVAAELGVPVTVRKVPGGLIFWRSSEEDLQQAHEVASRLQTGRRRPQTRPRGRRPRGTR
jgi:precorrin-4 methylase